jgi:hypothetical protein
LRPAFDLSDCDLPWGGEIVSKRTEKPLDEKSVQGLKHLKKVFGMLERLAPVGCERDKAGNRQLLFSHYAGLMLVGLFNPTLQSLGALSSASGLKKVQRAIGGPRASVGSLSESVRVFDPSYLEPILEELLAAVPTSPGKGGASIPDELVQRLRAVDGTALRVLPQIVHACHGNEKWRLHLHFHVLSGLPQKGELTPDEVGGEADERSVLERTLQAGCVYIADRGYERYRLLQRIVEQKSDYVIRVQRRPMAVIETNDISQADRQAGVVSDETVQPGQSHGHVGAVTHPVRRIVIEGGVPQGERRSKPRSEEIVLLTSLIDVPAEVVAAIYRLRWSIELFFRFFKHVLGCRELLSGRPEGIAIQVYCALIGALLIALATGQNLGRRGFELVCLFFQGWATEEEFAEGIERLSRKTKTL